MRSQRNLYFDDHFDLTNPQSIIGKTLAFLGLNLEQDKSLQRSVELLGFALFDKWEKVENILKDVKKDNIAVADFVVIFRARRIHFF